MRHAAAAMRASIVAAVRAIGSGSLGSSEKQAA